MARSIGALGVEQQPSGARHPQRVRLNESRAAVVVEFDEQMIGRRETKRLQRDADAPCRHSWGRRPRRIFVSAGRDRRHLLEHDTAFEPAEELR